MSNLLSEQDVLSKFNIPSFEYMTNDDMGNLIKMVSEVESDVLEKAINEFKDFDKFAKDVLINIDKIINSNDLSTKSYYKSCDDMLNMLRNLAEKDNCSFEEKKFFIEEMHKILSAKSEKDTENKNFLKGAFKVVGVVGLVAVGLLLGGKGTTTINNLIDDDYDDFIL